MPADILRRYHRKGFTLIELLIVVSIIALLAAIAIPKFSDLIQKAREGATKGNLGAIRSALSIYYSDMEGIHPWGNPATSLTANGQYLATFPNAYRFPYHKDGNGVVTNGTLYSVCPMLGWCCSAGGCLVLEGFGAPTDGWLYSLITQGSQQIDSAFYANCSHTDTKGISWSLY